MYEPEKVQRARKLVERGRVVVEEQRQRIVRLRAIGASTDKAEAALEHFKAALSALEYGLDLTQLDLTQQARWGAGGAARSQSA